MDRRLETQSQSGSALPLAPPLVPGLTILAHPDPQRVGERAPLYGLAAGETEHLGRGGPLFAQPGRSERRPLDDLHLSRQPIALAPLPAPADGGAAGEVLLSCQATRTAVVAGGVSVTGDRLLSAHDIACGTVLLLANRIALLLSHVAAAPSGLPGCGMIGESPEVERVRREILRVAPLEVSVLLAGETGTGKELAARALHDAGPRRGRPFLTVNMGAIPASLAAAELFGAARGAFTGADRPRQGFFQRADGGTLFLDEIGETPAETQALLLRALESGEIQPVGSAETRTVDVRVIAATDARLAAAVERGRFKAPLLHRLCGYEIRLPPLRERREDFGRLFFHFLRGELRAVGAEDRLAPPAEGGRTWMPAALVARLAAQDWPGNVRQLRNVARQLAVGCHDEAEAQLRDPAVLLPSAAHHPSGGDILLGAESEAPAAPRPPASPAAAAPGAPAGSRPRIAHRPLEEVADEEILAALRASRWRVQRAATRLGVARASLYDRIDASSLFRKAADLTPEEIAGSAARCGGNVERMAEDLEVSKQGLRRRMTQLA